MSPQFESDLQNIVDRLAPQFREQGERDIAALRNADIASYDDVLTFARDAQQDKDIRRTAIWVLGCLRDTQAVPPLLAVLATDAHPEVRHAAAQALGDLDDTRAVAPLIEAMQTDTDSGVRKMAAYALRWLEDAAAVEPLVRALQNMDEDEAVRAEAAESLGQLGEFGVGAHQAFHPLIAALRDPSAEVRLWSAFALSLIGDPRALPELERVAATDEAIVPGLAFLPSKGAVRDEAREAIAAIRSK